MRHSIRLFFFVAAILFIYRPGYADVYFTDVTDQAGVGDMETGRGSSFNDYDGDGDLDIMVVNGGRNVLYRNNRDGTFTDVTEAAGIGDKGYEFGAAFGDYDNDGDLDLYIVNGGFIAESQGKLGQVTPADLPTPNTLYRNNGDGTFTDVTDLAGVGDPGWGFAGIWGDLDEDGWLDIFVTNMDGPNVLYHNNGDGTFSNIAPIAGVDSKASGIGAVAGDYDNDGDLDLFVANYGHPSRLYHNHGDGTFLDVTDISGIQIPRGGFSPVFADFDNDGYLDIYVTVFNILGIEGGSYPKPGISNRLYHNNGDRTFTDITSSAGVGYMGGPMGLAVADYDNDGYVDIYLANGGPEADRWEANVLYHNNRDGTFTDVTAAAGVGDTGASHGVSWGDYDADGDLDLYVPNGRMYAFQGQRNTLYRNEGGNTNHWLAIRPVGRMSNRDGIGTRIRIVIANRSQIAEVSGGSGFVSQNSFPVEFGLGIATQVDSVIVRWPSGLIQILTEVGINQTITLVEGEGGDQRYVGPHYRLEDARVTPANLIADGRTVTLSIRVVPASHQSSGATISQVTADLTPVGGAATTPLYDDGTNGDTIPGDGIYTMRFTVSPEVSPGKKSLKVRVIDSEGRRFHVHTPIAIFPSGDAVVYGDGVAPAWQIHTQTTISDPASQGDVYSGAFSHAITLKGNGYLDYTFTSPEGLDSFGYAAVEGYIHLKSSSVTTLFLSINGNTPAVSLTEGLNQDSGWIKILIPIEQLGVGTAPIRFLRFRGYVEDTFYLDDLQLVAQPVPTDVPLTPSDAPPTPSGYILLQNYPNPFNSSTTIPVNMQRADKKIQLLIYDLLGQQVRTLIKEPGSSTVVWDGKNEQGGSVPSGVYLYRLNGEKGTKKMVLIR